MDETERKRRNEAKLMEMHPVFRVKISGVLAEMEQAGYRPRIQEAWRSERDQAAAFAAGTSKLKYGFHNVTAVDGAKEALAADILDDDHTEEPPRVYILHLAAAALRNGLMTGAFFDLSTEQTKVLYQALVDSRWEAAVSTGWDPCHVQILGVTVEEARAGKRPTDPNSTPANPASTPVVTPSSEARLKRRYRLTDLVTNRSEDFERETAFKPVTLLAVPWVSMLGPGADLHSRDSMAACAVMLLRTYLNLVITPDDFYVRFAMPEDSSLTTGRLRNALGSLGLLTDLRSKLTVADLFLLLGAGIPALVLLRYQVLASAGLTEEQTEGTFAALVVGMDSRQVYLHDPLYADQSKGEAHAYPVDLFLRAWTGTTVDTAEAIPERSAIIPISAPGKRLTRKAKVSSQALNVRQAPMAGSPSVGTLKMNEMVEIRREVSGWGEIGENRWVSLRFVTTVAQV